MTHVRSSVQRPCHHREMSACEIPLLEDRERYLCAVVVSGVVGDIARGVARTQLALVSLATTNIYAEIDLKAKEEG